LTGVNLLGVRIGKWTQNSLSLAKFLGLAMVCAAGLFFCPNRMELPNAASSIAAESLHDSVNVPHGESPVASDFLATFGQAMIIVLFAYGGWNEMSYVGAEVRNPRKNIFRALWLGTLAVAFIYVLANLAFVRALGFDGMKLSKDAAGDTLELAFGKWGRMAIQWLIVVTALGAIQGMIFTGARIYYAMGGDYRLYAWLGRWNGRNGTPVYAMLLQGAIALSLIVGFGLREGGFAALVNFTTPVFWIFFGLAAAALIVLRIRRPEVERPFRVPFYPVLPIVFCLSCLFMIYASLSWAVANRSYEALWAIVLMAAGIAISFANRRKK
jgi:amino acid transporter